jgi:hypothetical protein
MRRLKDEFVNTITSRFTYAEVTAGTSRGEKCQYIYIKTIHDKHEGWLVHCRNDLPEIVVELDGNGNFSNVENEYDKLFCVIADYLQEISK